MIKLQSAEQLSRATERAKVSRLFVRPTGLFRQYRVTNRDNGCEYTVDFFLRNGQRFGHCTCKAGMNNQLCKHLSAAAGLHVMLAAARQMEKMAA
ncbi:MAG: hypothetical protein ICV68_02285 [Pyrinomonadaceae bacterium]|nr:hypothetical protein [Pyrinomonadaceae bacterium]